MKIFWLAFSSINLLLLIFLFSCGFSNSEYETKNIQGWKVKINRKLWKEEKQITKDAIALLDVKLKNVDRVVPRKHHDFLKSVTIWVEKDIQGFSGMVYHPSAKWLKNHGYNPDKAKAVEITNIRNFISRTKTQPWHVLHELAHAYHDNVIGKDFQPIINAYNHAVNAGLYRKVPKNHGKKAKDAYALKNKSEYFAELSEAYFGENDFYPFNRKQLKEYDIQGYSAIEKAWKIDNN
ncbi:hypothetical protein IQ247_09320 [Plectonema cf. radiosum LEGE 06105]|uniref:Metallopeptidase n=1 Tax=Plectonema cf. radiosum LEGE 06105 TaxID=945769 RepID=A0A8J7F6L6_9CYAN|nr:hypothetical protein [Plectonema radiosum]MBE9212889.1 hypothetical protein [Plectonema cf. radiosum LEGE 06105]